MSRFRKNGHVVDAAGAQAHLVSLSVQGIGYRRAARLTKVSIPTIKGIKNGRRPRIRRSTELRILAVQP